MDKTGIIEERFKLSGDGISNSFFLQLNRLRKVIFRKKQAN